jgi:hypothetical protein
MDECKNRAPGALEWKEEGSEREKFEKSAGILGFDILKDAFGNYVFPGTEAAWVYHQDIRSEIDALKAENKKLRKAIPRTPESMISFIGPHFNGMRTADYEGQTYVDLSKIEYWLTIHDLLSAFSWSGLESEEMVVAMTAPDTKGE